MGIANCVLCFSTGNVPRRLANYCRCFSIPFGSILELLGSRCIKCSVASFVSSVLRHSSVPLHHSSLLFCTIGQFSSAPFVNNRSAPFISTVLHHWSVQFCTVRQQPFCTIRYLSSAPFVGCSPALLVSYHFLPFVHAILQFGVNKQPCYRCAYNLSTI